MQEGWTLNMQWAAGTEAGAWSTTWKRAARHSRILRVEAVVLPPSAFRTLLQRQLVARAAHLVQPHAVRALAKMCLLPGSRHAAVKTEWERRRPSVCCELNNFHAAQEANCTPLAHKTWLDQVPKTKTKQKNLSSCWTCISQRHLNLRRNNEPDSFSAKQMFFMACSSEREWRECLSYFWRQTTTNPHTHSSALLASTACRVLLSRPQ